jgi:TonB family protein
MVEVKDGVVQQVMPDVLRSASETIHGQISVRIRVAVDPSGNVSNAELDSPGTSKYFAKVALQAAQQWKFKPAQAGGQAVSSVWILQFKFTQAGTNVISTEVSR